MFLSARDEETGAGMTDRQLRDEVMTMLLAGHETTSLALSWTYYLLSQHPDIERGIADEVDRVIGSARPAFAHADRADLTRRAIEESLRLYPPAWGFSRLAIADDEIGGYRVPEGSMVFLIPFVIHRRPKLWPDPDRFDPDRFARSTNPASAIRIHPVWRRPARLHRQSVRDARGPVDHRGDRAAVSNRARAGSDDSARAPYHVAASARHSREVRRTGSAAPAPLPGRQAAPIIESGSTFGPLAGTSFNGRTPRSGRGYWGSNPYVPATLPHFPLVRWLRRPRFRRAATCPRRVASRHGCHARAKQRERQHGCG